jgi:nucleoid-associated protein YgaU
MAEERLSGEVVARGETASGRSLDALAKGLGDGSISRRLALRLILGTLFGALLFAIPDVAQAALRWGNLKDFCLSTGGRRYSAVLWGIPWGQSWVDTCYRTPGPPGTVVAGMLPTLCEEGWGNVWGNWDVSDPSCPVKCPTSEGCYEANVRCTGAVLWNTCWCPRWGSGDCQVDGLGSWPAGVCIGYWDLGTCLGGNNTYVVQSGQTLSGIAPQLGTTVEHISAASNIANPNLIYPGQVLRY